MPEISITDALSISADIDLRDDAPIAGMQISQIGFANLPIVGDFAKPLNECSVRSADFGIRSKVPEVGIGNVGKLSLDTGLAGHFELIGAPRTTLFEDDTSPTHAIASDEYWAYLRLTGRIGQQLQAKVDGFGFGVQGAGSVGLGTYVLLKEEAGHFPTLREGFTRLLNQYSVSYSSAVLRQLALGTITETEITGSLKLSGTYSLPMAINPLACAQLPFGAQFKLQPEATVSIGGQVTLTGIFKVRSYRASESVLIFGVYKKNGAEFTVTFSAGASIEGSIESTDLLPSVLGAIFPGADLKSAGLTGDAAKPIAAVLKESIDQSLGIAMNASWAAGISEEAALVYSIDLAAGDQAQTDSALGRALDGDWSSLDRLPNATCQRNLFRETHQSKHTVTVHLLGIYNAESTEAFVRSCTVLHDENGQIVIADKVQASEIAVSSKSAVADSERLRSALSDAFLATASYVAVTSASVGSSLQLDKLSVQQTYLRYGAQMNPARMQEEVLLGRSLKLLRDQSWDGVMTGPGPFKHVKVSIFVEYDRGGALALFFRDPATQALRDRDELEHVGRQALLALIIGPGSAASEPSKQARAAALSDDAIWKQMNEIGNTVRFRDIPGLAGKSDTELAAIAADWCDVVAWAKAISQVGPSIAEVLAAAAQSSAADPNTDPVFTKKRKALANALASVAHHSRAAFAEGWGLAANFALSGGAAEVHMDIAWNGQAQHYDSIPALRQAVQRVK